MSKQEIKIRTVQWIETDWRHGEQNLPPMRSSEWLRTDPPALTWDDDYGEGSDHNVRETRGTYHTGSSGIKCI